MHRHERHAAIQRLIREQPISTQSELADALRAEGHEVVQTTVSRDVHELGLTKIRNAEGQLVYVSPEATAAAYVDALSDAVARWALSVDASGNLVVVTTPHGYASPLAEAIDLAHHPHILGTIAGENTVLLISREPVTGAQLADEIQSRRRAA